MTERYYANGAVVLYDERPTILRHLDCGPVVTIFIGDSVIGEPEEYQDPAQLRELAGQILAAAGELERLQAAGRT